MDTTQIAKAQRFSDRDLIEALVSNFYILDYGVITKVNEDGTVNVQHAKIQETNDGTKLPVIQTNNIELLTLSTINISFDLGTKAGDRVLLLGLKDYIAHVEDVTSASEQNVFIHYKRDTMKALPLCVFNGDAKIKVKAAGGNLKINAANKIALNGENKNFVTWAELNDALQDLWGKIKTHTHPASSGTTSASVELSTVTLDISDAKTKTIVTGG